MDAILRRVQEKIQRSFGGGGGGGSKYFSGTRRGEGLELRVDIISSDVSRQKRAVKRIIANMTMGRDVSYLFVDVVKLGQTTNLELKKLVYLYILNTAKMQPDKALMAVNTFLQDSTNPSPIVRALAVRTMMCMRVEATLDYTMEPLRRAVVDKDPYVRKTAAIGLGKLFHHNMEVFFDQGFATELVRLLMDKNPLVASNAAAIIQEVNDYGRLRIESTSEWVNWMLIHLPDCSEWGQVYVLHLLSAIVPKDVDSAEKIIARIMPRLNHTNPAVVMATIKVLATYASKCKPESIERFTVRINGALLTLAKENPETQFVVYKNIHALLVIFPNLLRSDLDAFYVRFNDPPYVKLAKLRLLLKLATPATAAGIVNELNEYSNEVDALFVEEVISAIASLAIKVESVSMSCAELLMRVVDRRPELLPRAVTAAKNIVRKYPDLLLLEPLITQYGADAVVEEEAKVSLIWMLGEYCDFIESGPVILQQFIDTFLTHEQSVQLTILSAVIKVFLRDPSTMDSTLNSLLEQINANSVDPDLRDRAFAYWRLLSQDLGVEKIKSIVHEHMPPVNVDRTFSDAMTMGDLKRCINTAAVVFGQPFQSFSPPYGFHSIAQEDEDDDIEEAEAEEASAGPSNEVEQHSPPQQTASPNREVFDDLFGETQPPAQSVAAQPQAQKAQTSLDDLFA